MNAEHKPTVAVSYSWKTEKKGPYTQAVEEFCALLKKRGITVIRDKGAIPFGGAFIDFMVRLNEPDRVAVFLSKAYLKSPNCTFELVTLWEKCDRNETEFFKKVRVWIMSEDRFRLDSTAIKGHRKYWEDRAKDLAGEVKEEINAERDASALNKEMEDVRRISGALPDLLRRIAGRLSPLSAKDYSEWIASEFPSDGEPVRKTKQVPPPDRDRSSTPRKSATASAVPVPPPKPAPSSDVDLEEVYSTVLKDMDVELRRYPGVAAFLQDVCPDCLTKKEGQSVVRRRKPSERHAYATAIESVAERIVDFSGGRLDRLSLALVMGGFAVLTVDPAWVHHQRQVLTGLPVEVPGREELLAIEDGEQVDFLHLIVKALVGGLGTLTSMFGCNDRRRAKESFAESQRAVGEANLVPAVMRFVVRLTREKTKDLGDLQGMALEDEFQKSKDLLRRARKKRKPFWISEARTASRLQPYRTDLALEDLLMVLPSGSGTEEALVKDVMALVSNLKDIFEHLKPDLQ